MRQRTYKQIESSRNTRLWITEVVIPLTTTAVALYAVPEVRNSINNKYNSIKRSINEKVERRKAEKALKRMDVV